MQPPLQQSSTCSNCGGVLEETPGGGLGCMSCLLRAGIGSEEETVQDSTPDALEGGLRFGVYEIDCHPHGSLYELGRGAMGVTYRATDTSRQRKVALKIIKIDIAERSADARPIDWFRRFRGVRSGLEAIRGIKRAQLESSTARGCAAADGAVVIGDLTFATARDLGRIVLTDCVGI